MLKEKQCGNVSTYIVVIWCWSVLEQVSSRSDCDGRVEGSGKASAEVMLAEQGGLQVVGVWGWNVSLGLMHHSGCLKTWRTWSTKEPGISQCSAKRCGEERNATSISLLHFQRCQLSTRHCAGWWWFHTGVGHLLMAWVGSTGPPKHILGLHPPLQ